MKQLEILVLADMIEEFDRQQPSRGRETTAFIKRWRKKEMAIPHRSAHHMAESVALINREEIEQIRRLKKFRDERKLITKSRRWPGVVADCTEVL